MGKHVEFGKDLGLMAEVVRRGLSIGIGDWEFWQAMSKLYSGLWPEAVRFTELVLRQHLAEAAEWPEQSVDHHHRSPDIDTLAAAVSESRRAGFEKRHWQYLAEDAAYFRAMRSYLCLAPPYTKTVEVDYDHVPPYMDGYTSNFPLARKKGQVRNEMSIYVPAGRSNLLEEEIQLHKRGWVFADQFQLHAFGQGTKRDVRPWAIMGIEPIYAPGSRKEGHGFYAFPRLWTLRGNYELDPDGLISIKYGFMPNFRTLIVRK